MFKISYHKSSMISYIFLTILFVAISIVSPLSYPNCNRLSNGCELKSYYCQENPNNTKCHMYVCDRFDVNFRFDQSEMDLIRNCSSNNPQVKEAVNNIYFQLSKWSIINDSFDLLNNELFLTSLNLDTKTEAETASFVENMANIRNKMSFRYVKGFEVGKFKHRNISIRLDFYYSKFDFYYNKSLVRSDDDLINFDENSENSKYLFNAFNMLNPEKDNLTLIDVRFYNCEYKNEINPLNVFILQINCLRFYAIQNTYYKRNFPRFQPMSRIDLNISEEEFRSSIFYLDFVNMQNIELNSFILNEFLFSNIVSLRLFGDIVSIKKGLFKSFKDLKIIYLDIFSTRKLMNRGIDWLFDFNSGINVDVNNSSMAKYYNENDCVKIIVNSYYEKGIVEIVEFNSYEHFPDEDFCLYTKFPFNQLVLMLLGDFRSYYHSCTFLWFVQNNKLVSHFCQDDYIEFFLNLQ